MNYDQGYQDGYYAKESDKATTKLFSKVLRLFYLAFIFLPLCIGAYKVTKRLEPYFDNNFFIKILVFLAFTYLFVSLVFFVKGIIIALKVNRKTGWIPIWVLCVLATCGLQIGFAKIEFSRWLNPINGTPVSNYDLWSWLGALVIGLIVYNYYKFHIDIAPRLVFGFYSLGFRIGLSFITNPIDAVPDKSRRWL